MKHLKSYMKFENSSNKKSILIIHGYSPRKRFSPRRWFRSFYKGSANPDKVELLSSMGFDVYSPHIDYDLEWNKDKCKSIMNKLESECLSRDIDIIIGTSLGGYTSFLLSNKLNIPSILINPAFVRDPKILDMPSFDFDYNITNPKTEIFSGELDDLVLGSVVKQYLDNINYKYEFFNMKGIGHSFTPELFNIVVKQSKLLNVSTY